MKTNGRLFACIMIAVLFLVPCCLLSISVSVSSNSGGYSENLDAGVKEAVKGFTTINKWGLQHSLSLTAKNTGTVGLTESHSVGNKAGSYAEVGVAITKAKSIRYAYYLYPGEGNWLCHDKRSSCRR